MRSQTAPVPRTTKKNTYLLSDGLYIFLPLVAAIMSLQMLAHVVACILQAALSEQQD